MSRTFLCSSALALLAAPVWAECTTDLPVPEGVTLTAAEALPQGEDSPLAHCRITGQMNAREGVDGMAYALGFELRLPDEWNGRFVHQFNGGNDGEVKPAFGPLLSGNKEDTALARGYAVVSSNAGHDGSLFKDFGLSGGARFGFDPAARAAYGYTAVRDLNPVASALTEEFYGREIAYSYGIGGSNGGRHAMVAAARMPGAFDGLLVGYPGFNLPRAALQHALDVQAFHSVSGDLKTAFSREDLTLFADKILAACDGLDGLSDGLVGDMTACLATFDSHGAMCAEQSSGCLSEAQVTALDRIFAGPMDDSGAPLYSDWAWDPGIASGNWRFWKLESPIPPWGNKPIIAVMGAASLAQIFTTPPTQVGGSPDELEQFLLDFDIAKESRQIFATSEGFDESAMAFMTPPNVDNPKLAEFQAAGGKMLILHGNADPVFSVLDTAAWYDKLDQNNGDDAEGFAMFYPVPGMPHGAGGPSTDGFDVLTPLVNWVENGQAPGAIPAHVTAGNAEGQAALGDISRPLCPYPTVARYKGGDEASADSFACE
ncbi:tannase/feruloyl esterase family alpha/beta hydrolase [Tropicibacter naphthalenivorans]|uniref:Tannase and feruloyl esterase n=1 Tax=Tropicibacter naphthalenivorans TaxID=441103 RepID=A0A0P1G047_9RHOB|nr:tannase/feruloyl esterase family alpha/beta hydrolase [Tropicibacter naphthalenivorans]CUH74941.1 Tannase and feruloyl esterase [Tropicibacter naphthalenivorans]SMC47922.1 feruloyl esterase [Tropicibacter naphthalenivorans]